MDSTSGPEAVLIQNLRQFIAFARKRVGDAHLAEDLVQESLLKAIQADRKPAHAQDIMAWFYRILRRSIIDLYRRNDVKARALEKLKTALPEAPDSETEAEICRCFRTLMADLAPQYRELLEQIDLQGGTVPDAAARLGISANNATVRLHRARKLLRTRLEQMCLVCSAHWCLDCACDNHA